MSELFNKAFPASKAFLIGVEHYSGGPSPLQTPFNDIDDLKQVLESTHNFLCPEVENEDTGQPMPNPLKDPVADDIRTYLRSIRCGPNDRVVIYFACHGIAEEWDERPKGFILAADAGLKKGAGYISMDEIMSGLEHLPCRHLLLVLDCCFAGAIRWAGNTRGIGGMVPKSISVELFQQFSHSCARQILTSSTFEESLDIIGTRENQGRNSPFAQLLIGALETGAADLRFGQDQCDGLISVSELHLYLRDRIFRLQHTGKRRIENRQIPLLLPFGKHDKGEFVFLNPKVPLGLHRRSEFNPYKGAAEYGYADNALFYGREALLRTIRSAGFDMPEKGGGITVIYGPACSGKSSLAKAGLLARYWRKDTSLSKVHMIGAGSSLNEGFREVLKEVYESREPQYLLIDPFDEWLSDTIGAQESRMMTEAIGKLAELHQIILIMRPMQERKLRKLLATGGGTYRGWKEKITWFEITPPSADEIMGMIERPAVQQMLTFASDETDDEAGENFVNRLVQDLLDEPGAIPLLSLTMHRLYKDRAMAHDSLSEASYDNFGTVTGVLAGQAEHVYALYEADAADRKAFQCLCFRMIQFSGGKITANKINVSGWLGEGVDELQYGDASTSLRIWKISQELLRAGVITEELKGDEYFLLPAHSKCFPKWERMQGWLSAKQDGHEVKNIVRLHHQLSEACAGLEAMPAGKQHQLLNTWAARHDLWELEGPLKPLLNKQELTFFNKIAERRKQSRRGRRVRYAVAGVVILALAIAGLFGSYSSYQTALQVFTEKIRAESVLHPPAIKLRMLEWASKVYPSKETDSLLEDTWNEGVQELHLSHRIIPLEQKVDSVHVLANSFLVVYEDGTAVLMNKEGRVIRRVWDNGWTSPSFSGKYFLRGNSSDRWTVWNEEGRELATMIGELYPFYVYFNGATDDVIFEETTGLTSMDQSSRFRVWRPGAGVIFNMITPQMVSLPRDEYHTDVIHYVPEKNGMLIAGYDLVLENSFNFVQKNSGQHLYESNGPRRYISRDEKVFYDPAFVNWGKVTDSVGLISKSNWPGKGRNIVWYNSKRSPKVADNFSTAYIIDEAGYCYWGSVLPGDTAFWDFRFVYGTIRADAISENGQRLFAILGNNLYVANYKSREVMEFAIPASMRLADDREPIWSLKPSRSGHYLLIANQEQNVVFSVREETFKHISSDLKEPAFQNHEGDTLVTQSRDGKYLHVLSVTAIDRNLNNFRSRYAGSQPAFHPMENALLIYNENTPPIGFSLADHQWLDAPGVRSLIEHSDYKERVFGDSSLVFQNLPDGNWTAEFHTLLNKVIYDRDNQQAIVELLRNEIVLVDVRTKKLTKLPFSFFIFHGCQFAGDRILIAGDSSIYSIDRKSHKILEEKPFPFTYVSYFCERNGGGDYLFEENGTVQCGNFLKGFKWQIYLDDLNVNWATFEGDDVMLAGYSRNAGSDIWYILNRENGSMRWMRKMPVGIGDIMFDKPGGQIFYFRNKELKAYSFPVRIRKLLQRPNIPPLPEAFRQWTPKRLESWWNYVFSSNE